MDMSKKTHIAMVSFELAETKFRWYFMIDNLVIQINDSILSTIYKKYDFGKIILK